MRAFLYSCIDSVEQLETLLVLRSSGKSWSTREMAQEIGVSDTRARTLLEVLVSRGLAQAVVREEVTYGFRPASETLARYCDELAAALDSSRADVLRFVESLPPASIRSFANAFRLRDPES